VWPPSFSRRCAVSSSHKYTNPSSEPPTITDWFGPKRARMKFLEVFWCPLKRLIGFA
jgi:hypothetical protein